MWPTFLFFGRMGDDGGVVEDVPESDSDIKWNDDGTNGLGLLYT